MVPPYKEIIFIEKKARVNNAKTWMNLKSILLDEGKKAVVKLLNV